VDKIIKVVEDVDIRLDKYLIEHLDDMTRTQIQQMITNLEILVNNKPTKPAYKLRSNDVILVKIVDPVPLEIESEDIPLDIYYEDSDLIVVNKPSGMVVHPAFGNYKGTLVNALMHHCKDLSSINGVIRAGIVHRIDKDTSGLLVACKNDFTHKNLSKQFSSKSVTRKYIALVHGIINHNLGKIEAPIGRSKEDRKLMTVIENGKPAVTNFKVLERFKEHTLVELSLETGRTHQIRVHMKYIGFPVVGDPQYGLKKDKSKYGQYLHAKILGFIHPRRNKYLEFDSPLPDYFIEYLNDLRANN
jgi:23S rRNA pseudouridine1911/1915/1917 synthase